MPANSHFWRGQFLVRPRESRCRLDGKFNLAQVLSFDGIARTVQVSFLFPHSLQGGIPVYTASDQTRPIEPFADWKVFSDSAFDAAERFWETQWS